MASENILINIKIEGTENEAKINSFSEAIIKLQTENKKLAETNKELAKAEGDNTAEIAKNTSQIEANKQQISQGTASRKGLIQTIIAEDNSIKALSVRNAELIKERNLINTGTDEGKKKIQAINAQLDANNAKIKENSDAMGKQRLNIGNYASALDGVIPGLGGMVSGLQASTKAALAFIATPIGAVIGALGLAFGALMTYIKGSDEAGDRFAKTTATLGLVFEGLKLIVEKVGGFIFDTIEFIAGGVEKIIGFVSPAAGAAIEAAKKAGAAIADIQDEIENKENEFLIKRAKVNAEVQALREKAIKQEGDAKRKTIQEAIDLEKNLAKEEAALAQMRLDAFNLENKQRIAAGKLTSEQLKQQAELTADVINQQAAGAQATIKFQKELERLNDEQAKQNALLAEQRAIELQQKEDLEKVNARLAEQQKTEIEETPIIIKGKFDANAATEHLNLLTKSNTDLSKIQAKQRGDNTKAAIALSAAVIGLAESESKAGKTLAVATIATNTAIGISNAVKAGSGLTFPANLAAILSGITAVLVGITQAKSYLKFQSGGVLNGPSHANGGIPFSVGGRLGFEAEGGEAIINKRSTAMFRPLLSQINAAGGGVQFAAGGIAQNEIRIAAGQSVRNQVTQVQPVLVLQDFEIAQMDKNIPIAKANVL